jgi:hypothetical protein
MSPLLTTYANGSARGYGAFSVATATTSFESIATQTVTGSTAASVEFTSIPSTYTHLQIRATMLCDGQQNILAQFNSDTSSSYSRHDLYGTSPSTKGAGGEASKTSVVIGFVQTSDTYVTGSFVADILDYKDTNKYKTMRSLKGSVGYYAGNAEGYLIFTSGLWQKTNAITSIKIYPDGTNLFKQNSTFALYGIKSA